MLLYLVGNLDSVLIKEMSFFQGCPYRGLPLCILRLYIGIYKICVYSETNLKVKEPLPVTAELEDDLDKLSQFRGTCIPL